MKILGISDEDFVNYSKPAMFIAFPYCSFKCGKEYCQNYGLKDSKLIDVSANLLIERYMGNPITKAVVCCGLEPLDSWDDLKDFIAQFRYWSNDDIVIYSGYTEDEIGEEKKEFLKLYGPIVLKVGRYIPNDESHYDEILGVNLASRNQYAIKI